VSLRLRLLTGLAGLVSLGLVGFGVGTYVALDHSLVSQLDQQLKAAVATAADNAGPGPPHDHGRISTTADAATVDAGRLRAAVASELFVEFLGPDGTVLATVPSSTVGAPEAPKLPTGVTGLLPLDHADGTATLPVLTFTTAGTAGGGPERVAMRLLPGSSDVVVVAGSLHPVTQTLDRLLAVEFGIGAMVLLVTLGLGLALARQATRPLEAIATTADAIAAGDLSRRVTGADRDSEVGRVSAAINGMLVEIEEAFARRDATETRLRRFVADASHELSTPLTSIRGYAELFRRGLADRPEDLAKAMDRIEREGARMGGLVDDLLLLASLDNGRPLHHDPVDLGRIAADTAADLQATDPDRAVTADVSGPLIALGDEDRLRQVAANLASNARRHTPPGTPITIRARRRGRFGVLEVADLGPGLAPEAAERVLDRFYRVDKARSRGQGGTGLGLSIVATIAEALGGQASLETAEGEGATFSVAVPLALATEVPTTTQPSLIGL
jgi:two-component system, OmpR family, sensor kinase